VVLSTGPSIGPHDLPPLESVLPAPDGEPPPAGYHQAVLHFKRAFLRAAIERAGGNRSEAARTLGLQRTYLARLIKEFGLRDD
jgi:DNA-binding NtrC family response regulator